MKKKMLWSLIGATILILSACGQKSPIENPLNYEVQSFEYTNQDNEQVSLEDLKGTVWVADFIFTSCDTVCPPMTAHMAELQQKLENEGLNTRIVSFSVDPKTDTPDKLKEFAEPYSISFENWDILTGYSQKEIEEFAKESFKTIVQKPESTDQVIHGTYFYLIDQNGTVLKDYNGVENPPYDQMITDIKAISQE
ncbi:SCO family protein [Metabacillus litoralis]|uniref:SCO family protein n=1 Tax=Metabacillus litoralis TaxID=152268 RepID=UPI001E55FEF4|nr:SCO family protein [Metabacillus litoralis]UHA58220.1 SCO family protein [Metabacillus litoralis]